MLVVCSRDCKDTDHYSVILSVGGDSVSRLEGVRVRAKHARLSSVWNSTHSTHREQYSGFAACVFVLTVAVFRNVIFEMYHKSFKSLHMYRHVSVRLCYQTILVHNLFCVRHFCLQLPVFLFFFQFLFHFHFCPVFTAYLCGSFRFVLKSIHRSCHLMKAVFSQLSDNKSGTDWFQTKMKLNLYSSYTS